MMGLKRFFIIFLVYSFVLFSLTLIFAWKAPGHLVSDYYWLMAPFFLLVVILSRLAIHRTIRKNPRQFNNAFLSVHGGRLLLYLVILLSYAVVFSQDAIPFIVIFFIYYVLYTLPEVYLLYRELHQRSAG